MISIGLIVVTCAISYFAFERRDILNRLSHHPYSESKHGEHYRLVSSGFVHGSWGHLGINMFVLYQFGSYVESLFQQMYGDRWCHLVFMAFYISAIAVANLGTYFRHQDNTHFSSVGASGVTSALVFIFAIFDPWQMFIFPPVPAIVFAGLYVAYSTWASKNRQDNIDHMAHLFGGLYGVAFLFVTYPDSFKIFLHRLMGG